MGEKNKNKFDIIIVGGGPAGATAALYGRRHGLKILLVDKATFPRDKICGDALSGKSVTVLRDLGLLEAVEKLPGAFIQRVTFGSPKHVVADIMLKSAQRKNPPKGFVIRRKILDAFLFEQAKAAADECIEGFSVDDVLLNDDKVCGIRGKQNGSTQVKEFHAPVVLAADGFNSVIARRLGLYDHDPGHMLVALRRYYKNVKGLTDQIELHYVDEVIPGYFWIFPLENGYANVGIGMLHKYIKKQKVDLKKALQDSIDSPAFRDRFVDAEPMEDPAGWNLPVGSKHRQNHGDGFMLLGDAAGLIDPFTGEGIGNAMYSGRIAAEVAAAAVEQNDFSANALAPYDKKLWGKLGNELKVSTKLQHIGRNRLLLNFVINKAARSAHVSDIIAGMMANEVPRKQLANPLFYLKLLIS